MGEGCLSVDFSQKKKLDQGSIGSSPKSGIGPPPKKNWTYSTTMSSSKVDSGSISVGT